MNNLSWLIYFGDVVGGLNGVFFALVVMFGFATFVLTFLSISTIEEEIGPSVARWAKIAACICIAAMLLAAVVPSKQTVYMIAASEAGQDALQSQTGQKAVAAINRYLDGVAAEEEKDNR